MFPQERYELQTAVISHSCVFLSSPFISFLWKSPPLFHPKFVCNAYIWGPMLTDMRPWPAFLTRISSAHDKHQSNVPPIPSVKSAAKCPLFNRRHDPDIHRYICRTADSASISSVRPKDQTPETRFLALPTVRIPTSSISSIQSLQTIKWGSAKEIPFLLQGKRLIDLGNGSGRDAGPSSSE